MYVNSVTNSQPSPLYVADIGFPYTNIDFAVTNPPQGQPFPDPAFARLQVARGNATGAWSSAYYFTTNNFPIVFTNGVFDTNSLGAPIWFNIQPKK